MVKIQSPGEKDEILLKIPKRLSQEARFRASKLQDPISLSRYIVEALEIRMRAEAYPQ